MNQKKTFLSDPKSFTNDQVLFVKSLLQNPIEIGQVVPSSRFLSERMVAKLNLEQARVVVEFGPGTGSVTRAIVDRLGPKTAFIAMESNEAMISILQRRFPNVQIIHDSAEHVDRYLNKFDLGQADYIISSLPFALLEPKVARTIIEKSYSCLREGGAFVTYQYIHARLLKTGSQTREQMSHTFKHVHSSLILRNIPPAIILRCVK